MSVLVLKATRDEYSARYINRTLTVGELITHLQKFNKDMRIVINNGDSYGSLTKNKIGEVEDDNEG